MRAHFLVVIAFRCDFCHIIWLTFGVGFSFFRHVSVWGDVGRRLTGLVFFCLKVVVNCGCPCLLRVMFLNDSTRNQKGGLFLLC